MSTYSNGPGNIPRLPDRVVDTLIDSAGVSRCAPGRGICVIDQTAQVERLVHAVCEELLARLPSQAAPLPAAPAPTEQAPTEDEFAKMMSDVNATHITCMMGNMIYNLSQKKGHILTDADCEMFSNLREQWDAARQAPTEATHNTFNEFWASDADHFEACGHSEDFARSVWHAANKDNV